MPQMRHWAATDCAKLPPAAAEPVLHVYLDWPACVAEVAPHFLANGTARGLRKRDKRRPGRACPLLEGLEIGFERGQHEAMSLCRDLHIFETCSFEQRFQFRFVT